MVRNCSPWDFVVMKLCWTCKTPTALRCEGCQIAAYCNPHCQSKDWEKHALDEEHDADVIVATRTGKVYVGGLVALSNKAVMSTIGAVVSAVPYSRVSDEELLPLIGSRAHMRVDVHDDPEQDLRPYFEPVAQFITQNLSKNVLVHCIAGHSRSVSLLVYYMVKVAKVASGTRDALEKICAIRPTIEPNEGFVHQLLTLIGGNVGTFREAIENDQVDTVGEWIMSGRALPTQDDFKAVVSEPMLKLLLRHGYLSREAQKEIVERAARMGNTTLLKHIVSNTLILKHPVNNTSFLKHTVDKDHLLELSLPHPEAVKWLLRQGAVPTTKHILRALEQGAPTVALLMEYGVPTKGTAPVAARYGRVKDLVLILPTIDLTEKNQALLEAARKNVQSSVMFLLFEVEYLPSVREQAAKQCTDEKLARLIREWVN